MNRQISFSWSALIAFLAFSFVLAEMHELVHTNVGYLLGGCYGERDFNGWGTCEATRAHSLSYLSTLSGPIFTFIVMWLGYWLIRRANNNSEVALGLAVLFASSPFARIFTVLMKGGDEFMVMRILMETEERTTALWLSTTAIILAICIVPLIGAYRALPEQKRWLSFLLLFIGPTAFFIPIVLLGLNPLLKSGLLASPGLLGAPLMISLWFLLCLFITIWKKEHLKLWIK